MDITLRLPLFCQFLSGYTIYERGIRKTINNFAKLQKGDEEAFSFFYRFFINDMYAYGKSLGVEDDSVMDAIQDVFLKIFFNKPQFNSVAHLKFFLLKSLKNKLYDFFKYKPFSNTTDIQDDAFN